MGMGIGICAGTRTFLFFGSSAHIALELRGSFFLLKILMKYTSNTKKKVGSKIAKLQTLF